MKEMSMKNSHSQYNIGLPCVTQDPLRVRDPGSSFCAVQRRLPPPSEGCCQPTHGQSTGGHAAKTSSSSLPLTQQTSPAGLDEALLKCCRSDQLSNMLLRAEKPAR